MYLLYKSQSKNYVHAVLQIIKSEATATGDTTARNMYKQLLSLVAVVVAAAVRMDHEDDHGTVPRRSACRSIMEAMNPCRRGPHPAINNCLSLGDVIRTSAAVASSLNPRQIWRRTRGRENELPLRVDWYVERI